MATFHPRGVAAAALVLILFVGGSPSWAAAKPKPGKASSPRASLQEEVVRLVHLVLGHVSGKGDNFNNGNTTPGAPTSTPGSATPDIGSSLDPLG